MIESTIYKIIIGARAASLKKYNKARDNTIKIMSAVKSLILGLLNLSENKGKLLTNKIHEMMLNITKKVVE